MTYPFNKYATKCHPNSAHFAKGRPFDTTITMNDTHWNNGMMGKKLLFGLEPNIPKFHYSEITLFIEKLFLLSPLFSDESSGH